MCESRLVPIALMMGLWASSAFGAIIVEPADPPLSTLNGQPAAVQVPTGDTFFLAHALVDPSISLGFFQGPGPFIYTFDGIEETNGSHTLTGGVTPSVNEVATDLGDGRLLVQIESASPPGTELFPGGLVNPGTGAVLADGASTLR